MRHLGRVGVTGNGQPARGSSGTVQTVRSTTQFGTGPWFFWTLHWNHALSVRAEAYNAIGYQSEKLSPPPQLPPSQDVRCWALSLKMWGLQRERYHTDGRVL